MQKINPTHYTTIVYRDKNIKTIDYSKKLSSKEADTIIEMVAGLIDDINYTCYFYKHLYRLGPTEFITRFDAAKGGKYPSRLFAKLVRE